jgi:hypothetical protein
MLDSARDSAREAARDVSTGFEALGEPSFSDLDLDGALAEFARVLASFGAVSGLSLKLVDLAEETVLLKRGDDFKREIFYGSRILEGGSFASRVLATAKPLVLEDIGNERELTIPSYVSREDIRALVAVPVSSNGQQMGVLTVYLADKGAAGAQLVGAVSTFAAVAAAAVRSSDLVRRMEKNYFATIDALTAAVEARDPYTRGHSRRVTQYALALAGRFHVSAGGMRNLQYGAALHDIGKMGIHGHILNKKSRLTLEEYEIIKQHPSLGERIIEPIDFLQGARPIVRSHHERFDGTGYPDGLRDEEIPFLARIAAIADFFDALTSDRAYRKAYTVDETNLIIKQGMGREFDPVVAREFLNVSARSGCGPVSTGIIIPSINRS